MVINDKILQSLLTSSMPELTQHDLYTLWTYGGFQISKYNKDDVKARLAVPGEVIITKIKGKVETKNTANSGDIVIKNPSGEEYIISEKTFKKQYENKPVTSNYSVFKCMGIRYGFVYKGPNTTLLASWGESQTLETNDLVACLIPSGNNNDIYRVEKEVLVKDYKRIG